MKTYEEILKDKNRIFNNWENYRLYKDGDTVIIDYPDEVCFNPTQEGQEKALRLLCKVYNEIKPHEEQIKADARRIKEEREKGIIWDSFRRIEECLNDFLEEYEEQKDCIEVILGEQTSNGQKKDKQSSNSTPKQSKKKAGRHKASCNIYDYVSPHVTNKEKFVEHLKTLTQGKSPKKACSYIIAAIKKGYIQRDITYRTITETFNVAKSTYGLYISDEYQLCDIIEEAKTVVSQY